MSSLQGRRGAELRHIIRLRRAARVFALHRRRGFNFPTPGHDIFKYLIPTLIALLAVKYQGKAMNPFETHPLNMWAFFTSICFYCLVLGFMKKMQRHEWARAKAKAYSQILGHVILTSGTLSSVSLATAFLPFWIGLLFVIVWAFLMGLRPLALTFQLLRQRIMKVFDFLSTFSTITEGELMEEQDLPV